MNQINVETNVIETEATELQNLPEVAILELNAAQLILVGGGSGVVALD